MLIIIIIIIIQTRSCLESVDKVSKLLLAGYLGSEVRKEDLLERVPEVDFLGRIPKVN